MLRHLVVLAVLGAIALVPFAQAEDPRGAPPKLVQLSYDEEPGGTGHDTNLGAHVKNATAVRFATGFDGEKARAGGKYRDEVTDTDINDPEAKHPWRPATGDGHKVVKLVHDSLEENGRAVVRLRMKNGGQVKKARVVIELSECSQDPPLYPVTCEVRP